MKNLFLRILGISIALIFLQSLFFKFTAHPESFAIFNELGMGAVGRILIGVLELVALILLVTARGQAWGAMLAWGLMTGAIIAHWSDLGWIGDRGVLGALAIYSWIASATIILMQIRNLPVFGIESHQDNAS